MSSELYRILAEAGETMNFNVGLYENELDRENTKLAKRVAKQFFTGFVKFCEEQNLELTCGLGDFPGVGSSVYLAVNKKGSTTLMVLAVPHQVIEIGAE